MCLCNKKINSKTYTVYHCFITKFKTYLWFDDYKYDDDDEDEDDGDDDDDDDDDDVDVDVDVDVNGDGDGDDFYMLISN